MKNVPGLEAIAKDYSPKGVKFYYIYKSLAHPGWNGYVHPRNLQERLLHVAEAKRTLKTQIPWLCDNVDDRFSKVLGGAPNSEFIIDSTGKIVARRGWSRPKELRRSLEQLVGPVKNPTRPTLVEMPTSSVARSLPVESKLPDDAIEIRVDAGETIGRDPHYVKLRADVSSDVIFAGSGTLFLRFELDPIYQVHWNNLSNPMQVNIKTAAPTQFPVEKLVAPKPENDTDVAPRTFELEVENWNPGAVVILRAQYLICDDQAGWCKALQREFALKCDPAITTGVRIQEKNYQRVRKYLAYRDGDVPGPAINATAGELSEIRGIWSLETLDQFDEPKHWKLHVSLDKGQLKAWSSLDRSEPAVQILKYDGKELRFLNRSGPLPEEIHLRLSDSKANGLHLSIFGDCESKDTRNPTRMQTLQDENRCAKFAFASPCLPVAAS